MQELVRSEVGNLEYERFFAINLNLLCIADLNGNFIKVNRAWEDVLGYSVEELEKRKYLEFVHPEDIGATLVALSDLIKQKHGLNFINRYRSKDGTYRSIEWCSHPYGDKIYTTARDITQKVRLEAELESKNKFLKQMLDAMPDLIFFKDIEGRYLGCNRAIAEEYFGTNEENIIGNRDFDFIKDEALTGLYRQKDREVLDTGEIRINEMTIKMWDKSSRDIEVIKTPFFDETGKISGLIGVCRDISERKSLEEKLRASEEKFRLLFENMDKGFSLHEVVMDERGNPIDFRFHLINRAYETQMKVHGEDILGKTILEINPGTDKERILKYCEVGLTGNPHLEEYYSNTFNRYFRVSVYCPQRGFFATLSEDITERKNLENALKEGEESLKEAVERLNEAQRLAHLGSWEMDIATGVSIWSDEFFRICGFEPNSFKPTAEIGMTIIHPDDRARATAEIEKAINELCDYKIEKRIVRSDGSIRYVSSKGEIKCDKDHQNDGWRNQC